MWQCLQHNVYAARKNFINTEPSSGRPRATRQGKRVELEVQLFERLEQAHRSKNFQVGPEATKLAVHKPFCKPLSQHTVFL